MNLFLFIHPAPYNSIFYVRCRTNHNTKLVFFDSFDIGHSEWGITFTKLAPFFLPHFVLARYFRLFLAIISSQSVVIPGYSRPESIFSILISLLFFKKRVLACDSTKSSKIIPPFLLRKLFAGFWSSSVATTNYLISLGVDQNTIFTGCYTITDSLFIPQRPSIDSILSIRNTKSFLFVGKLIPSRNILSTISSFYDLNIQASTLFVIGDGPDFASAEKIISENHDKSCSVLLLGNLPFDQIHNYYVSCTNYVHFGEEPHSTALELASLYGLNIASSLNCGYVHDLIRFGGNPVLLEDCLSSLSSSFQQLYDISLSSPFSHANYHSSYKRKQFAMSQFLSLIDFLNE